MVSLPASGSRQSTPTCGQRLRESSKTAPRWLGHENEQQRDLEEKHWGGCGRRMTKRYWKYSPGEGGTGGIQVWNRRQR